MRFGQLRRERASTIEGILRRRQSRRAWVQCRPIKGTLRIRKTGPRQRKIRVQFHRLLVGPDRTLSPQPVICYAATKSASAQIGFVGSGIVCRFGFYLLLLLRRKRGPQLSRNFNRQLALQGKRVSQGSIVALRPNLLVVARVDQLYIHDDAASRAAHASFQHMRNLQRLSNLAQLPRDGCAAVNHPSAPDRI